MKKIYITPAMKVKRIKPTAILAGSPTEGDNDIVGGSIDGASGIAAKQVLFNWSDNPIEDDELVD